jgi:hypothetical protein
MKLIIINADQHHVHATVDGYKFSLNLSTPMGPVLMDCSPGDIVLILHGGGSMPVKLHDIAVCAAVTSGHQSYQPYGLRLTVTRSVVLESERVSRGPEFDQEDFLRFLKAMVPNITELRTGEPLTDLEDLVWFMRDQRVSVYSVHMPQEMIRAVNKLIGGPDED